MSIGVGEAGITGVANRSSVGVGVRSIDRAEPISVAAVAEILNSGDPPARPTAVTIVDVNLKAYDALLGGAACR